MATLSIYLDTRGTKGEAPLKAVITHKRKSAMMPLGIKLLPKQWDPVKREVKSHPNQKFLNTYILGKKYAIEAELLKLGESGTLHGMDATAIRDAVDEALNPKENKDDLFVPRFERFMNLKTKKSTMSLYSWTLNKLRAFDPKIDDRRFGDITVDYLNDFKAFYRNNEINSIGIALRNIRAVFNDAIRANVTTSYPFKMVSIKAQKSQKKALTPEQMKTLLACECEGYQEEYRDMFLLMFMLRGINIGDLLLSDSSNIVNGRFEYRRNKVGTLFSIKIEPEAAAIIEKYRGEKRLLSPMDRYSDYRDYQYHLNDGLKAIGQKRGKWRKVVEQGLFPGLSSNWARHTWATCGLNLDIPVEVISRGMGHSGALSVTQIYMDFDMRKVDDANRKIIDFILYGKDYRCP